MSDKEVCYVKENEERELQLFIRPDVYEMLEKEAKTKDMKVDQLVETIVRRHMKKALKES